MSIENPQNKSELIAHCKMRLGEPMIKVNVTDLQAKVRIKEAVWKFLEYHFDATEQAWLRQEITPAIQQEKEFTVPSFVWGVNKVLNPKPNMFRDINMLGASIYSVLNRNLLSNVETMSKVDLFLYQREISEWEEIWRPTPAWHFNKVTKTVKIDTSNINLQVGDYIMYSAQVDISESTGDFFSQDWLIRYSTCLIKEQWGENLSKFKNIQLPGGHQIDVEGIKSEAKEEKDFLLKELYDNAYFSMTGVVIG